MIRYYPAVYRTGALRRLFLTGLIVFLTQALDNVSHHSPIEFKHRRDKCWHTLFLYAYYQPTVRLHLVYIKVSRRTVRIVSPSAFQFHERIV